MYDELEHAMTLLNSDGLCPGPVDDCRKCFVARMSDNYEDCTQELAYECAERFLAEAEGRGICISIW